MTAAVEEHSWGAILVTNDDDRIESHATGHVVAGGGDLTFVRYEKPGSPVDAVQLLLEYALIDECIAAHPAVVRYQCHWLFLSS